VHVLRIWLLVAKKKKMSEVTVINHGHERGTDKAKLEPLDLRSVSSAVSISPPDFVSSLLALESTIRFEEASVRGSTMAK
jgi:hypothetical protein